MTMHFTFNMSHKRRETGGGGSTDSDLVNRKPRSLTDYCHGKHSVNNAENGSQCELLQYLTDKRYRFSHNQKGVKKWCQNVCYNIKVNFQPDKK